ncbi:NADPH dependent preQ0 reductase [Pseudoalteromonas luteoviolacea B = ATCC 29581]|nr:NADPH dependent preQ0 reductase [Pseudoalteromonas luteoviolacea B = ATCC 29581]
MTNYSNAPELKASVLGKSTEYADQYDRSLLHPIARKLNRDQINVEETQLPFQGEDIWTGYELSWLNPKGKPQVAVATFTFPCTSQFIIESKSFKLYLNSFNQTQFNSFEHVQSILTDDLSIACGKPVNVILFTPNDFACLPFSALPGECIDDLDIECSHYQPNVDLLRGDDNRIIEETLHSHLLKSNCLITSQPDWASIVIRYRGPAIDHASLLQYLVSFRSHNEFHEQCVERIFCDIQRRFSPAMLEVCARYTRRGGLDINPYRSTEQENTPFEIRTNRQ